MAAAPAVAALVAAELGWDEADGGRPGRPGSPTARQKELLTAGLEPR